MACLSLKLSLARPAALAVATVTAAGLVADLSAQAAVELTARPAAVLRVVPTAPGLRVVAPRQASLTISDIQIIDDDEPVKPSQPVWNTATLKLLAGAPSRVAVEKTAGAALAVTAKRSAVSVTPLASASLNVATSPLPVLAVMPSQPLTLAIGEVCSITGGDLYALAGTDGPLRTRDGGYFLLDPEWEN